MRITFALVLLLIAAPHLRAETPLPETGVRPEIAAAMVEPEAPVQPQLVVSQVKLPEYDAAANAVATQEMPRRGSFWWLVGVIVVAGVILALVLD